MSRTNPELQLADAFVRDTGCNVFLTGKAGTGKTTFLHNIKKDCEKRMVVTAPTGVAAINAGGVTLHSFFQMPFGPFIPGSEHTRQHKFSRDKINIIKSLDLLVIDEISMVRADLLDGVDSVLRRYRRSNLAFGGVQLLLIGDLHQLAPVVKNEEWRILQAHYASPYFFSSTALGKTELISVELQHIYRQADDTFISLLNKVRDNRLDPESLNALNARHIKDFEKKEVASEGYITLCTHNQSADKINSTRLEQLSHSAHRFSAKVEGEFPEHSYPTPSTLELKVDAQVMFMRNDASHEKRYFNGKIGKITRISGDRISIKCRDDNDEIIVEPATWENIDYSLDEETMEVSENKIGAFVQYPLKLAWAITIHKSQGLTFDNAIIDAQSSFAHGQVYVALSRCRTLEGMVLSTPLALNSVKTDRTVLQFTEQAGQNLPTEEKLALAKIRYQQNLLLDCFDFQRLRNLFARLVSLVERNREILRLKGADDLGQLQPLITREICMVGENFKAQLRGLFRDDLLPSDDPVILERLTKASIYFKEKLKTHLADHLVKLSLETDNKEIRKKSRNTFQNLQEESNVKQSAIASCAKGFDTARYLRAITKAEIKTKTKEVKPPSVTYTETDVDHPKLYNTLKDWRDKKAKGENLTPFQVMHLKTIIQIAVNLPDSIAALKKIKGIGEKLTTRYGEELIDMVLEYRVKNNIETVQLPVVQDLLSFSEQEGKQIKDTKRQSLELFESGLNLQEIAQNRGLSLTTIEGHLAHYVACGEVDIDTLVAKDKLEVIISALKEKKTKKLNDIKAALGNNYSYGEIKLGLAYLECHPD
ncbi:helix-turn-helix domain-containing protein [Desulforhopalus sp. IMCC35007]|uniref:helix-turn-helix domain-containing protein n=1 Tax=Desulforhopalus sp. IMCC35007 TaxID=2569543 RepID=UPI0010AEB3BA|nr:helix-turn-helix domain-containing protein [Desulforhopalus sp. IMCC35007]TKB07643.1 helicase [Desulforhopalus sp. IMCC35007]